MANRNLLSRIRLILAPGLIIGLAAASRLLPHPPNVAPITGMALFGGAHLQKVYAFVLPLAALFVSDLFLGGHSTLPYVYGSFVLITALGFWLKKHQGFNHIVAISLASSVLFYLITNFGVWASSDLYPKTGAGLIESYVLALPFFRNTLIGDLAYTLGLFYGYRYLVRFMSQTAYQKTKPSSQNRT